jgi:GDPmannose 4,6-dehydratase
MKALVTGVCGQDGYYLSKYLLSLGYEVVGTRRGNEEPDVPRGTKLVCGDINDAACINELMMEHQPDEVYNLAALTHVGDSFKSVSAVMQTNAVGAANVIHAAYQIEAKVYQASTSELFGSTPPPQNETALMHPRSPYGIAKLAAYWTVRNYRERGMHATNGILFNHESPRRGGGFVTQKIARSVAGIALGKSKELVLGNLDAKRDWGHADDYCKAMHLMMQHPPDDYVVATGETHSVREFCDVAFRHVNLDYKDFVKTSQEFFRPTEVNALCGDASKIRKLGWEPSVQFKDLVVEMVDHAVWEAKRAV